MVLRVPAQPESDMLDYARDLKFPEAKLLQHGAFGPGASLWQSPTHTAGGIGYWIGHQPGDSVELYAYLALMPGQVGSLAILEAKKGWTDPAWRRKGLGKRLLKAAAQAAPLLSDSDSMTDMAFAQWESVAGFTRRWWDTAQACFVDEHAIPPGERFTASAAARRWLFVMELN